MKYLDARFGIVSFGERVFTALEVDQTGGKKSFLLEQEAQEGFNLFSMVQFLIFAIV